MLLSCMRQVCGVFPGRMLLHGMPELQGVAAKWSAHGGVWAGVCLPPAITKSQTQYQPLPSHALPCIAQHHGCLLLLWFKATGYWCSSKFHAIDECSAVTGVHCSALCFMFYVIAVLPAHLIHGLVPWEGVGADCGGRGRRRRRRRRTLSTLPVSLPCHIFTGLLPS